MISPSCPVSFLKHEEIKEYTTIWMDTVRNGQFGLSNTNKLVRFYDGTTGLKTGYTSAAGYCLSASAERGGMELVAVVLHCKTSVDRFESAKALLNYGFFRLRPRHAAAGGAAFRPSRSCWDGRIPSRPYQSAASRFCSKRRWPRRCRLRLRSTSPCRPCRSRAAARHNDRHGGRAAACRNSARRAGGRPRPHVSGALGGVLKSICLSA